MAGRGDRHRHADRPTRADRRHFVELGAPAIHLVDLDGAAARRPVNTDGRAGHRARRRGAAAAGRRRGWAGADRAGLRRRRDARRRAAAGRWPRIVSAWRRACRIAGDWLAVGAGRRGRSGSRSSRGSAAGRRRSRRRGRAGARGRAPVRARRTGGARARPRVQLGATVIAPIWCRMRARRRRHRQWRSTRRASGDAGDPVAILLGEALLGGAVDFQAALRPRPPDPTAASYGSAMNTPDPRAVGRLAHGLAVLVARSRCLPLCARLAGARHRSVRPRRPVPTATPLASPPAAPPVTARRRPSRPSMGDIVIELYNDSAPVAAANSSKLADAGYYDGIDLPSARARLRHPGRRPRRATAPAAPATPSRTSRSSATTGRGIVAMARTAAPELAGLAVLHRPRRTSQGALPKSGGYVIFGEVVVRAWTSSTRSRPCPTRAAPSNTALEPVPMESVTISGG